VADGNSVIAIQTPSDGLRFYWNQYGTNNWYGEQVAADGTTFSAPVIAADGNGVIIAAQGANNSLDFYWQTDGTSTWNPELVGGAGTTFSAPAITGNDGSANVAAEGAGGSLDFYWQVNDTTPWHPEVVQADGIDGPSAITTMNHGSGDGVCLLTPDLVEYCAVNGSPDWQVNGPRGLLFTGSDPAITENDGSDNLAIFAAAGDLLFFWDDSSGTFHSEVVDSDPT
jgi:hypothetical protein